VRARRLAGLGGSRGGGLALGGVLRLGGGLASRLRRLLHRAGRPLELGRFTDCLGQFRRLFRPHLRQLPACGGFIPGGQRLEGLRHLLLPFG